MARIAAVTAACLPLLVLVATDGETLPWLVGHHLLPLDVLSDTVSSLGSDTAPAAVAGLLLLLGVALDRPVCAGPRGRPCWPRCSRGSSS